MVTKLQKSKTSKKPGIQLGGSVKDSAQQIWQAGLGAFTKAQAEGTKAIEALVKEGVSLQRKTQSVAEEKISEATSKMTHMATDISSKASGQWDKLESIFEERVAKALNKLGVPSAKDVNALIARIEELNKSVQRLSTKDAALKPAAKTSSKSVSAPPAKKTGKASAKPAVKTAVQVEMDAVAKPAAKRAIARKTAKPATPA